MFLKIQNKTHEQNDNYAINNVISQIIYHIPS